MSKNLRTCLKELKAVANIKEPTRRQKALRLLSSKPCIFLALKEIARNTRRGNIHLNGRVRKYLKFIRQLDKSKLTLAQRTKLVRQSGGFLAAILPAVFAAVSALVSR